jgi:hypothetical protein
MEIEKGAQKGKSLPKEYNWDFDVSKVEKKREELPGE